MVMTSIPRPNPTFLDDLNIPIPTLRLKRQILRIGRRNVIGIDGSQAISVDSRNIKLVDQVGVDGGYIIRVNSRFVQLVDQVGVDGGAVQFVDQIGVGGSEDAVGIDGGSLGLDG